MSKQFKKWLKDNDYKVSMSVAENIGIMMEYLMEIHDIKEFQFVESTLPQIYDLLFDKIIKLDNNSCKFLINDSCDSYVIDIKKSDIHFMNKEDLLNNINFI